MTPTSLPRPLRGLAKLGWWTVTGQLRRRLALRRMIQRDGALLAASKLFDRDWYSARHPDVAAAGVDPLVHYLTVGAAEGRDPGPDFDTRDYLRRSPDVARAGLNPLAHYLRHGEAEGRSARSATRAVAAPRPTRASRRPTGARHVIYVSGEPDTPGHQYRVVRLAAAAEACGASVSVMRLDHAGFRLAEFARATHVVVWRADWTDEVEAVYDAARAAGAIVVFDADDLFFDPDLARVEIIDGIRSQRIAEDAVQAQFARFRRSLLEADAAFVTTEALAFHARRGLQTAHVVPNTFDEVVYRQSRAHARRRRAGPDDGLTRLGYAAGSVTHQKDFAVAADAIAATLRARPNCRLVLFREPARDRRLVEIAEFSAFADLAGRIEWRDLVPLADLPGEIARFDVNLVPLEVGNPFCEAKSELKFFEAALLDVCTIASPTQPLRDAIRHERTGVLASDPDDWRRQLARLVDDADWRRELARAARRDALARFGPLRAAERMANVLDQLDGGRRAAAAFAAEVAPKPPEIEMVIPDTETVFAADRLGDADVTVVVPLYNYAGYVAEALDSVKAQSLAALDLVVVDDASTDDSLAVATRWAAANAARFNRLLVLRNRANAGLGPTRNAGFDAAETPRVLPLDADNRLLPSCCETLLRAAEASDAQYVYPAIRKFGATADVIGAWSYDAKLLAGMPFVDAMALVDVAAWAAVGGYRDMRLGWEDYDLWCRFAEHGFRGEGVTKVLAEYRAHGASMLSTTTDTGDNKRRLLDDFEGWHPWVRVVDRPGSPPIAAGERRHPSPPVMVQPAPRAMPSPATGVRDPDRLDRLLPLLRCPTTKRPLRREGDWLVAGDNGPRWPIVAGRAALFPGMPDPRVHPGTHISNPLPESALALIRDADGLVLNLSAGGTEADDPKVVEAEAAIFRHTAVVADSHVLPFVDGAFAAVLVMNAFEHYHDPKLAAREILRVLRPGGKLLVRTAFLQPLHEAPWHFYNCTRYGLERWFADFELSDLRVSDNFTPSYTVSWLLSEAEQALRAGVSPDAAEAFGQAKIGTFVRFWRDEATRDDPLWTHFARLPQPAQEAIAAGFEFLGVKPEGSRPVP